MCHPRGPTAGCCCCCCYCRRSLMNAWAIYGVAKYYGKNGNSGLDPVSFGAFVVINLQVGGHGMEAVHRSPGPESWIPM